MEDFAYEEALKNRKRYGKAAVQPVLSRLLARFPELRQDIKRARAIAEEAVRRANQAPEEELRAVRLEKKKTQERQIPRFDQKVITRFAPEPSGYPHIGHAKAALYSYWIAKENMGYMILRFDDTNPKKETQEFVDAIQDGLKWIGVEWKKITFTSDYMNLLYARAEDLIAKGKAYVCLCDRETMAAHRRDGIPCAHREQSPEENLELWDKMFHMSEGEAVLRYKGDMQSPNTVMRDPVLFRIIDHPHFRHGRKYRVWPAYDFSVAVVDSIEGITHALRSKEYELRDELYHALQRDLGLRQVKIIEFSRLRLKGLPVGKRLLRPLVESGKVMGWNDVRLPTLAGLRRRGIHPEALRRFILSQGLKKKEGTAEMELLLAENRKVLDPITPRRFFVPQPVEIEVETKPGAVVLKNHPTEDLGTRRLTYSRRFYVPAEALRHKRFRLKDLFTVERTGDKFRVVPPADEPKFQWVPVEHARPMVLLEPGELFIGEEFNPDSLKRIKGFAEPTDEEWVQFERIGFAHRLDANTYVRCG